MLHPLSHNAPFRHPNYVISIDIADSTCVYVSQPDNLCWAVVGNASHLWLRGTYSEETATEIAVNGTNPNTALSLVAFRG